MFRFFPKRLIVRGKVLTWNGTSRPIEIGIFQIKINEDLELELEVCVCVCVCECMCVGRI